MTVAGRERAPYELVSRLTGHTVLSRTQPAVTARQHASRPGRDWNTGPPDWDSLSLCLPRPPLWEAYKRSSPLDSVVMVDCGVSGSSHVVSARWW